MDKFNFTIKDLVYIVTIIISVLGTYFTLKNDVDNLKEQIKDHNLELIEYKVDKVSTQLDEILKALK